MDYIRIYIVIFTVAIIIVCLFSNRRENFKSKFSLKKIGKSISKTTKKVEKGVEKTVKKVEKDVEKTADVLSKSISNASVFVYDHITTKGEREFINNQRRLAVRDFNVAWKSVTTKEERDLLKTFSKQMYDTFKTIYQDVKIATSILNMFNPADQIYEALKEEITTGHISWDKIFDPCRIINRAMKKTSKILTPLLNLISGNLAKLIVNKTGLKTLGISKDDLQVSLNACLMSALMQGITKNSSKSSSKSNSSSSSKSSSANISKGTSRSCASSNADIAECSMSCEQQIPKLICDVIPNNICKSLMLKSSEIYPKSARKSGWPTPGSDLEFDICKYNESSNDCQGGDISSLISWVRCLLAPEECAIAKTLGAICSAEQDLISGKSIGTSLGDAGNTIEGFGDFKKEYKDSPGWVPCTTGVAPGYEGKYTTSNERKNNNNTYKTGFKDCVRNYVEEEDYENSNETETINNDEIGAYYLEKFNSEVIIQDSLNQPFNLGYVQVYEHSNLYKNTEIYGMKYNGTTTLWDIVYNENGTIFIKSKQDGLYLNYGNIFINDIQEKQIFNVDENILQKEKILNLSSSQFLNQDHEWLLEKIEIDSYLYVVPTVVAYCFTIKHKLTGKYLSVNSQVNRNGYYNLNCSEDAFEWTIIPQKYYDSTKYTE